MELLISLCAVRDKENLKSIAQSLKLSGSVLEFEEKNKNEGENPLMDKVMELVVQVSKDPSVESHIATMMGNLPELRKANWGLGDGAEPAAPPPIPTLQSTQPAASFTSTSSSYENNYSNNRYQSKNYHNHMYHQSPQYYDSYASQGVEDDGGIFYAPDGQELTFEEYEFMNAQLESVELEAASEGDMPADVEAAFEEFLGAQNN